MLILTLNKPFPPNIPSGSTESPYRVACGERDIHQERTFGNGKGGGSVDEKQQAKEG